MVENKQQEHPQLSSSHLEERKKQAVTRRTYDVLGLLIGAAIGLISGIIVSFNPIFTMQIGMFIGLIIGVNIKRK